MGARIRVLLNPEEDRTLNEIENSHHCAPTG